jgi:eukaryotic-like serine/threonine-protein kinase
MIDPNSIQPPSIEELQALIPQVDILSFIGHGGMGTYYQARQSRMDRLAAVKIFRADPVTDKPIIDKFKLEARAMAGLNHHNIIKIYDFGESGSFLFIIMEYVQGDILERLIYSRGFNLEEIVGIITQVCDALAYAHQQGVIHRDIRPGNTMLDVNGNVKVGDFGLARLIGEELFRNNLTETNQAMGTMDYVAPEQFNPEKTIDFRADIYSVGMMLYKLLTRTLPYGTFTSPSDLVTSLDPRVDDIVIRCLQRNPDNRYQNIQNLRADLVDLLKPQVKSGIRKLHIPKA